MLPKSIQTALLLTTMLWRTRRVFLPNKNIRLHPVLQLGQRNNFFRMASSFRVIQHTVKGSHTREYIRATANGDADTPTLSVKQYIPLDNPTPKPGDVTIIGAHANGFPKVSIIRANVRCRSMLNSLNRSCMSPSGRRYTNGRLKQAFASGQSG